MKSILLRKAALGMMAAVLVAVPGVAIAADAMKGIIIANDGQSITVRAGGADTPVPVTSSTKIRSTTGALGARTESHPASDLIRGLAVEVKTGDDGSATEITFKKSDLKTAQQIDAGLAGTDARVAQNQQRLDDVGQLVPAGRTKVFFAVGSTVIDAQGKQDLQAIAAKAKQLKTAYRLVVVGRADKTGNAEANQRLSERRAAAVTQYLQEHAGILPSNFLPTSGLGDSAIADDPAPPTSDADARRVAVTIAVSKSAMVAQ